MGITTRELADAIAEFDAHFNDKIAPLFAPSASEEERLSRSQGMSLMLVWRKPGQTATQLGEALAMTKANLTRILDGLEEKGLVARRADPEDRRKALVFPTGEGQSHAARLGGLLFRYALPSVVGMVVSALYNIVDRIFIGRGVGPLALAGVVVSFPLQLVQIAFSVLIGIGAATLISIRLGEGKKAEAESVLGNGFAAIMVLSVAIAGLGLAFLLTELKRLRGMETREAAGPTAGRQ